MKPDEKSSEIITTRSIAFNIVDIEEDFILDEAPMSRLVFHAQLHRKGIKGRIIRQRRESKIDIWTPEEAIDIRTLGKNESINIEMNTKAVGNLYDAIIKSLKILKEKGIEHGTNQYAVIDPDRVVITEENKVIYIKKIISAGYGMDIWDSLVESNPSLVTKLSYARIQAAKQEVVKELEERLVQGGFSETTGDDSWQNWIYKNNWLFGIHYKTPIEKSKINITGIMPDYLFPTLDGFVDILEIKLPDDEVILKEASHPGAWRWTRETNTAIGQVVNYLGEIDRLRFEIEREVKRKNGHEIQLLKPRAYILIGNSAGWEPDKKEGLRKMNHALHGIEIISYKDLLDRGHEAISSS